MKAQIKLLDDTTIETNVDGDPGPSLPVEIQVLPQHITVFCGQEKIKRKLVGKDDPCFRQGLSLLERYTDKNLKKEGNI